VHREASAQVHSHKGAVNFTGTFAVGPFETGHHLGRTASVLRGVVGLGVDWSPIQLKHSSTDVSCGADACTSGCIVQPSLLVCVLDVAGCCAVLGATKWCFYAFCLVCVQEQAVTTPQTVVAVYMQ
jgi:hypothetical protein